MYSKGNGGGAMPVEASGEVKTRVVRQKQKNGDIYVIERKTKYDPEKKYNVVISGHIIGKIPKGTDDIVPTRPKQPKSEEQPNSSEGDLPVPSTLATREKVGMMSIIDHIGKASGIDQAIYGATDIGTAQKILSLARYLLGTNGQSLPGITVWQYNHPLPYEDGLSENIYHDLFEKVGRDETLIQSYFASRIGPKDRNALLAYDSTTISTYSAQIPEARYGFNKAGDGLKTVKLLTLYSIETRQPVAFAKQPGNLPDVVTIENALKQLQALGVSRAEIITDNGYYSEKNLAELLHAHFDFITLVKTNLKWVKNVLDAKVEEFYTEKSICPFDVSTHGIVVMQMKDFSLPRKYASTKKGLSAGDEETFRRRIYLHLYFNPVRKAEQDIAFDKDLFELKHMVEDGKSDNELTDCAVKKKNKYLIVHCHGKKTTVSFNERAIAEVKKYHGYFALVSNCEREPFECLQKYRRRERIESFFESGKQRADSSRTRVWSGECLMGRMFVQFVALCYYEYFSEQLRQIKQSLKDEINMHETGEARERALKERLLNWLQNTPVYLVLQWFDVVEEVNVSSKLRTKRWTSEITERDRLLLRRLGVIES